MNGLAVPARTSVCGLEIGGTRARPSCGDAEPGLGASSGPPLRHAGAEAPDRKAFDPPGENTIRISRLL
jgi:hypothetical protein